MKLIPFQDPVQIWLNTGGEDMLKKSFYAFFTLLLARAAYWDGSGAGAKSIDTTEKIDYEDWVLLVQKQP